MKIIECYTHEVKPTKQIRIKNDTIPTSWEEAIAVLLQNRGIESPQQREAFFRATVAESAESLVGLFSPDVLNDVATRITAAVAQDTTIVIHGDYDVDGISATAILWEYLYKEVGFKKVMPFIPHRTKHGYGLSRESIDDIRTQYDGESVLVITVDCGITAREAVIYGQSLGLDFVITDHHTIQEAKIPAHVPILHTYELCGAGIAWVLTLAMHKHRQGTLQPDIRGLDLVALATLADIQPVMGFNRVLVKEGLVLLTHTDRVGLQKLYERANIAGKPIGNYEVGWVIAPRINAMGRLEHALDSLRLLCTTDAKKAENIAGLMHETNRARQDLTTHAIEQAMELVATSGWDNELILVVHHEGWHEGVLGLIAGKLVERFGVPAIALGVSGEYYKGSARSVREFDIIQAIKKQQDLVEEAGGHAMAAGLTIQKANVDQFRTNLAAYAYDFFGGQKPPRTLDVDMVLPFDMITMELAQKLQEFAPFGIGNPRPLFLSRDVVVLNRQLIGAQAQHLKLSLGVQGAKPLDAIAFNTGSRFDELELGTLVDVVYSVNVDTYFDTPRIQVKIQEIILAGAGT